MEDTKKEVYEKPVIHTEEVELNVYGKYEEVKPIAALQPFFGLCCT